MLAFERTDRQRGPAYWLCRRRSCCPLATWVSGQWL